MADLNLDFIKLLPNILHTLQNTTNNNSILQLLGDINHHFPLICQFIDPCDFEDLPNSDMKYIILYKLYLINNEYERAVLNAFKLCRIRKENNFESLFSTVFYEREICRQALGMYKKLNKSIYEIPEIFKEDDISDLKGFIKVLMKVDIPFIDVLIEFIKEIPFQELINPKNEESKLIINKSKKFSTKIFNSIKVNIGKPKFYFLTLSRGLNEFEFEEFINSIMFFLKNEKLLKPQTLNEILQFEIEEEDLISNLSYFFTRTIKSPFSYRICHYLAINHVWFANLMVKSIIFDSTNILEIVPYVSVLTNERGFLNRLLININTSPVNQKILTQFCRNSLANAREIHIAISIMNGLLNAGSSDDSFIRKNVENVNCTPLNNNQNTTIEFYNLTKDREINDLPEFILYSTMGIIHRESDLLFPIVEKLIDTHTIYSAGILFSLGLSLIGKGLFTNKSLYDFYNKSSNINKLNDFNPTKKCSVMEILERNSQISNLFIFFLKQGFVENITTENQSLLTLNTKSIVSLEVLVGAIKGVGCFYANQGTSSFKNEEISLFENQMLICLINYALQDLNCLSAAALISIGQIYSETNDFKILKELIKLLNSKHERIFDALLKCISMICLNGHELFEVLDSKFLNQTYKTSNKFYKLQSADIFWYIFYQNAIKNKSKKIENFLKKHLCEKIEILEKIFLEKTNDILKDAYFLNLMDFIENVPSHKFDSVLISIMGSTFSASNNLTAISILNLLTEKEEYASKIGIVIGIGLITVRKDNYKYFEEGNVYETYEALKSFLNSPDPIIRSTVMLVIGFSHTGTAIPEIVNILFESIQYEIDPIVLQSAQISMGLILNQNGSNSLKTIGDSPGFAEINSTLHANFTSLNPSAYIHGTSLKFGAAIARGFMNLGHFGSTLSLFRNGQLCINNLTSYLIVCDPLLRFDKWLYVNGLIKYTTFSILIPKLPERGVPETMEDFFVTPHVELKVKNKELWKIDKLILKKKKHEEIGEEEDPNKPLYNPCVFNGKGLIECGVESEILFEGDEFLMP